MCAIQVTMQDGSVYVVKRLLGRAADNRKIEKNEKGALRRRYLACSLSLAPERSSGFQVCPHASAGCRASCIFTSGNAQVFKSINRARIAKTRAFFMERVMFLGMLRGELRALVNLARWKRRKLICRLNIFSDIVWERVAPELFTEFPTVQFYDYTKNVKRMFAELPANYHLTFSRSETNEYYALGILAKGRNVTVVFSTSYAQALPERWKGYRVIDGDTSDLRFLDPVGVVVGLRAKGKARAGKTFKGDSTGFVVSLPVLAGNG